MNNQQDLLRAIPKVDELLSHPQLQQITSRSIAAESVRETLESLRSDILNGSCTLLPSINTIIESIVATAYKKEMPSLRRVINATGVVLHTNLGRSPLADSAMEAVVAAASGYSTLEYNVETGARGSRYSHVEGLLSRLTGAESALVVNNNASAVLLMLSALTSGREVIVSRGELVEIGGAFRIPDVMAQSGAILKEVGTTNRTRASDYESAILPEITGALFKAHSSNYKILGFTEEASLDELVALGHKHGLPVLHDLGSGSLLSPSRFGLHEEPGVPESLAAGVDIVSFSGDKLLGGPQAGILLGKQELIVKLKKHPLTRAVRIDKLTLAALEATLRLYLDPERAVEKIPTLRMLASTRETLRPKAERFHAMLGALGAQASVVDTEGQVGGGSAPNRFLPSSSIEITPGSITVDGLEQLLRSGEIPVVGRIAHDRYLLDVRTIEESDFAYIAGLLKTFLGKGNA